MSFLPGTQSGTRASALPADQSVGAVDYRMARMSVINQYKGGRLNRSEVCDAHPELRRAADNLARTSTEICPICEDAFVVLVTYAFGSHLPKSGYVIEDRVDMNKVRRLTSSGTGYVVEVCRSCGWNHLVQSFPIQGRRKA